MALRIDISALLQGDRNALSRAITFLESNRQTHRKDKWSLLDAILPHTGKSLRIGISGPPGVGKSSFIDRLGMHLIDRGHRVGVLAVDPSSSQSGGSILGDRTRMTALSSRPEAFIRPSPSSETLGGVAARSREVLLLMEAAGYDVILVETVGVGQSEVEVKYLVDVFVLMLQPGAGDDLQGIKRGIMEMADMVLLHKSDGAHLPLVKRSLPQIKAAVHLLPPKPYGLMPAVIEVSSLENRGVEEAWEAAVGIVDHMRSGGFFKKQRTQQDLHWFEQGTVQLYLDYMKGSPLIQSTLSTLRKKLLEGQSNPVALLNLFDHFLKKTLDVDNTPD